jgi:uracil-DNA glycosylase
MQDLARFLGILEEGPSKSSDVFNPWRHCDARDRAPRREMPRRRLANLEAYMGARERSARVMLMGEAPSHRGCRFTGIAFCSEVELVTKRDLVARRPLELSSVDGDAKPMRERSAAVIWSEIERAGCAYEMVLWNAFPWHPHGETVTSNRKPRKPEVEQGREALRALLDCFTHPIQVFAVGKVAEEALGRWEEFECAGYIRHPSQGGESRFREGFRTLVAARL